MLKSKEKFHFYSLDAIKAVDAQYNIIIGERSNGKTYATLEEGLRNWWDKGEQTGYIRRWKEDYRGKRGESLFNGHVESGFISKLTDGEFDRVKYYSGKWYLAKYDEELDRLIPQDEPFCYAFALSDMEHDKSTSYPKITTIIFDEFLTRSVYLPDEFVIFMNVLSTIIRLRTNVTIYMLANTVNKYAPYFKEMGLKHVSEMQQGKIDVYNYGESGLKVAVEYCVSSKKESKKSNMYFAFDNPSLSMITGGAWELSIYPHCPRKFTKGDVVFTFFIDFDDTILQCEVVSLSDCIFIYIHVKTTPIKDDNKDIIFSSNYDPRPNHFRNMRTASHDIVKRIGWFFKNDKVFYQDNEVGELVRNYLNECTTMSKSV